VIEAAAVLEGMTTRVVHGSLLVNESMALKVIAGRFEIEVSAAATS
jgi:hypothetical protein